MRENIPETHRVPNTIVDFIDTAKEGNRKKKNNIVCPACGSEMGTVNEGSFRYMLTDRARGHLNNKIDALRQFAEGIESNLRRRNFTYQFPSESETPYIREHNEYLAAIVEKHQDAKANAQGAEVNAQGEYTNLASVEEAKRFTDSFDPYDWIVNYENFPLINEKLTDDIKQQIFKMLILGSEPPALTMAMNVVFEQEEVEEFRKRLGLSSYSASQTPVASSPEGSLLLELPTDGVIKNNNKVKEILKDVCPFHSAYLGKFETTKSGTDQDEAVRRLRFALTILLGHKYSKFQKADESAELKELVGNAVVADKPYHLPERTYISIGLLRKLINNRALFDGSGIDFPSDFVERLRTASPSEKGTLNDDPIWFEHIHRFVNFTCAHVPTGKSEACGWYPKHGSTHPIVLLGSQGTGKSSLMMTGLTALYNSIGSIHCVARPEGFLARQALEELDGKYLEGVIEPPTRRGAKNRIELSIAPVDKPFEEIHFVFLDIAGEDVASLVTGDAPSQDLTRLLSNAKTIVFLFDFTAEPSIREILPADGEKYPLWKAVRDNFSRTEKERKKTNHPTKISLDQFNLLTELVHLLRKEVGPGRLKETNFACVIPKADLFVDPGMDAEKREYFLTGFFNDLQEKRVLVSSPHTPTTGFEGKYTLAGVFKDKKDDKSSLPPAEICRYISDKAKEALGKIGDTLPTDTNDVDYEESRSDLARKINERLIHYAEECFTKENCYFIPVSALGEDPKDLETAVREPGAGKQVTADQGERLGHRPNQKLSEYVFLLPIVLALPAPESGPAQQSLVR